MANTSGKGKGSKTLKSQFSDQPIEVPRDRNGGFEPLLIHQAPNPLEWVHWSPAAPISIGIQADSATSTGLLVLCAGNKRVRIVSHGA